jgi:hypothetical protein
MRLRSSWSQPVADAPAARDLIQHTVEEYAIAAVKVICSDTHGMAGAGPRTSGTLLAGERRANAVSAEGGATRQRRKIRIHMGRDNAGTTQGQIANHGLETARFSGQ